MDCLNTLAHELEADPSYAFACLSDMRGETYPQKLARVRHAVESAEELRRLLALVAERADFTGATQLSADVDAALSSPNISSQRTRPLIPAHQPAEATTQEQRPGSL